MDLVAVGDGVGAPLAGLDDLEVDLVIGAECLQHGIEALPRPPEQLAKPRERDAVMVGAEALGGGLELPPQGLGVSEPGVLLWVVEPYAQGLTYGRIARRGHPSRGCPPVKRAIEALDELVGQADTDETRMALFCCWHGSPLLPEKHYVV
jgi:hypothetical protein